MDMPGVEIIRNNNGEPVSVQIDLRLHHELWENIYDSYIIESRKDELSEDWETVLRQLGFER